MNDRKRVLAIDDEEYWQEEIRRVLSEVTDLRVVGTIEEFQKHLSDPTWSPDYFVLDWVLTDGALRITASDLIERTGIQNRVSDVTLLTQMAARSAAIPWAEEHKCQWLDKDSIAQLSQIRARTQPDVEHERSVVVDQYLTAKRRQDDLSDKLNSIKVAIESAKLELESTKQELESKKQDLESTKQQLELSNRYNLKFVKDFTEIISSVVDESLDFEHFIRRLLTFLIKDRFEAGAVVLLRIIDGILQHARATDGSRPDEKSLIMERMLVTDFGDSRWYRSVMQEGQKQSANIVRYDAGEQDCVAVNAFRDQVADGRLVGRRLSPELSYRNILILPLRSKAQVGSKAGLHSKLSGYVLLWRDAGPFLQDAPPKEVTSLPVASIVHIALEMPFRFFERQAILSWIPARVRVAVWRIEEAILHVMWESIRIALLSSAVLALLWPFWELLLTWLSAIFPAFRMPGGDERTELFRIVHRLDIVVTMFSVTVLSLGILILYEPRFFSNSERHMPAWITRLAHVDGLKRTILTLVSVIVAVTMLEQFVSVKPEDFGRSALGWLIYLVIGLGIIASLAVFIKMNLRYDVHKKDHGNE